MPGATRNSGHSWIERDGIGHAWIERDGIGHAWNEALATGAHAPS